MKLLPLLLASLLWVQAAAAPTQDWKVTPDPSWDACFQRTQGWNGADGAYSVGLAGGWTGWLFSDTMVGTVNPDGSRSPDNRFLHNSWARIEGQRPANSVFSSDELIGADSNWYWVYQPVLEKDHRGYLFLGEFTIGEGPEGLNFRQVGTCLAQLDWRGDAPIVSGLLPVPYFREQPAVNFGAAVIHDDQWIYVYGTRDFTTRKEVLLARVPQGHVDQFERWQFWPDWSDSLDDAKPLLKEASNEFSVFWKDSEVRLLTQVGNEVRLYRSSSPSEPFSESVVLQKLPQEDSVMTYNAKAHPEMGWPLLITYNRNALPPELIMKKADRYRPRCLRLSHDPWLP